LRQAISAIFVAPPVEQQLHTFAKPIRTLLVKRLRALLTNPRPPGLTKLEGVDHLYRIREGGYRIVYAIRDRELIVLAVQSGIRTESGG
jgi:mRNA interferase RelE/StbE